MTKRSGRRRFLRGTGAVMVGLPFLARFQSASADPTDLPKRLFTFYTPNGFDPDGRPTSTDLTGSVLEPLAGFRDRITTIHGMEQASRRLDPTDNDGAHYHGWSHCTVGDNALFGSASGRVAGAISYDQLAARTISAETRFGSVVEGGPSWLGADQPAAAGGVYQPQESFDRLFADFMVPNAAEELERVRMQRRSILDFTMESARRLDCQLGAEDRERLGSHLESIRDLERRLAAPIGTCLLPDRPRFYPWPEPRDNERELWTEWARTKIQLVTTAIACDLTRVGVVGLGGPAGGSVPIEIPATDSHHELSHDSSASARAQIRAIDRYYAELFRDFLSALDAIEAGEGVSVLDQSCVLWLSEAGGRDGHQIHEQEYVVAGGAGGYLRQGQRLELGGVPHNNLLLELINASYPRGTAHETSFGNPEVCDEGVPQLRA